MCVSGGEDTQGVGASAGHVAWELSSSEENILFLVCFIIFFGSISQRSSGVIITGIQTSTS